MDNIEIKMQCLTLAGGNISKAQEFYDFVTSAKPEATESGE